MIAAGLGQCILQNILVIGIKFGICYGSQIIKDFSKLTSLKVLVHKSKKEEQPSCKKADEKVMSAINLLVLENRAKTEILPLFC